MQSWTVESLKAYETKIADLFNNGAIRAPVHLSDGNEAPLIELFSKVQPEDWVFCSNWRDLGGKIWVDKRVLLRHTGTYTFCNENERLLMDTIGPMYLNEQRDKGMKLIDADGSEILR